MEITMVDYGFGTDEGSSSSEMKMRRSMGNLPMARVFVSFSRGDETQAEQIGGRSG